MFFGRQHKDNEDEVTQAVQELKRGSAEAFHLLYRKYNRSVYRFCLRMLNDQFSAEDAFQETFIRVFEHRKEFRGENFSSWLFSIARNVCLNTIRSRKEKIEINEDLNLTINNSDSDVALKDFIQQAIGKLPVTLREALILREYEECSYQDIADILSIELSAAKVRVHRGRILLREMLQPIVKEIYEN